MTQNQYPPVPECPLQFVWEFEDEMADWLDEQAMYNDLRRGG